MPVSSITLTVAHLPTSTSFYLAALQPLGYRYIGQWGNQIGLGADGEADFFLTQEVPGLPAGSTHVAFTAPSRAAVHSFFAAALSAGATPHGTPGARHGGDNCFNAAVLDFDGNSVEVVYHETSSASRRGSGGSQNGMSAGRVLEWREDPSAIGERSIANDRRDVASVRSSRSERHSVSATRELNNVGQNQVSPQNVLTTLRNSMSGPSSSNLLPDQSNISISSKALAGTILGAAAGAAVAYAMCKSEEDSARAEAHHAAMMSAAAALSRPNGAYNDDSPRPRSRRGSLKRLEAPHAPDMFPSGPQPPYMNVPAAASNTASSTSRREMKVEYVPVLVPAKSVGRSPSVLTTRSARRLAEEERLREVDPIPYSSSSSSGERERERPARSSTGSALKSEVSKSSKGSPKVISPSTTSSHRSSKSKTTERRGSSSLPDIGEDEQLTTRSVASRQSQSRDSRASKKALSSTLVSSRPSSRHSRHLIDIDDIEDEKSTPVTTDDDRDTVVPSDSISCIGSSTAHSHRSRKTSSSSTGGKHRSRSKESDKRKHRKPSTSDRDDIRSEPPIRKPSRRNEGSAAGRSNNSDATITPRNYKERSVTSLPIRGVSNLNSTMLRG